MKESIKGLGLGHSATYRIAVLGRMREGLSDWLLDMTVETDQMAGGPTITTLTGVVQDQAALHGILNRIRDLNIALLSVELMDPEIISKKE